MRLILATITGGPDPVRIAVHRLALAELDRFEIARPHDDRPRDGMRIARGVALGEFAGVAPANVARVLELHRERVLRAAADADSSSALAALACACALSADPTEGARELAALIGAELPTPL